LYRDAEIFSPNHPSSQGLVCTLSLRLSYPKHKYHYAQ